MEHALLKVSAQYRYNNYCDYSFMLLCQGFLVIIAFILPIDFLIIIIIVP